MRKITFKIHKKEMFVIKIYHLALYPLKYYAMIAKKTNKIGNKTKINKLYRLC